MNGKLSLMTLKETNMNKLKQILSFLNEETPIKNSQIILETIFLTFLVIWFTIKG